MRYLLCLLLLSACHDPVEPVVDQTPDLRVIVVCPARVSYWDLVLDDSTMGIHAFGVFGLHPADTLHITQAGAGVHSLAWSEVRDFGGAALHRYGAVTTNAYGQGEAVLVCH